MKRIAILLLMGCLLAAGAATAQNSATQPHNAPTPVAAPPQDQQKINDAWKDMQIAQMALQLAVTNAMVGMEKGTYYDYQSRQFLHQPAAVPKAEKPVETPQKK